MDVLELCSSRNHDHLQDHKKPEHSSVIFSTPISHYLNEAMTDLCNFIGLPALTTASIQGNAFTEGLKRS